MIIITVEGGFVQEVYSDNPGELVLIRDFDASPDGVNPEHMTEKTLSLQDCDLDAWPDVDMNYYRELEKEEQNGTENL